MHQIAVRTMQFNSIDPHGLGALSGAYKGIAHPVHRRTVHLERGSFLRQLRQGRGAQGLPAALRPAQQLTTLPRHGAGGFAPSVRQLNAYRSVRGQLAGPM